MFSRSYCAVILSPLRFWNRIPKTNKNYCCPFLSLNKVREFSIIANSFPFSYIYLSKLLHNLNASYKINYCTSVQRKCWNCNSLEIKESFCTSCKFIQPVDKDLNYFEVLGLTSSFDINRMELMSKYRSLQSILHPDKFSLKSEREQQFAADQSSLVNKAYNTIISPISRGEYLLNLNGLPIEEGEITLDPEFLMDIMEVNERLAEAENKEAVLEIAKQNNMIMENLLREASESFASQDIHTARIIIAKLKYFHNIYEKVKQYETEQGIIY